MKVIDFLTKLAKNEEIKKVKFNGVIYEKSENGNYYHNDINLFEHYNIHFCLNDEIEIIEENKPIEKLSGSWDITTSQICRFNNIEVKINEIIDKLNKLEEGK